MQYELILYLCLNFLYAVDKSGPGYFAYPINFLLAPHQSFWEAFSRIEMGESIFRKSGSENFLRKLFNTFWKIKSKIIGV